MSFKTKALGLAAATALSLSIVTGVMADGSTTVKLNDGKCLASVTSAVDFGSYTWDGSKYVYDASSAGNTSVSVGVTDNRQSKNCDTTVTAGTLTGSLGGTIAGGAVTFKDASNSGNPFNSGTTTLALTASIDLSTISVAPDTYSGNITVTSQYAS